jgi:hypothetical protein
VLAFADPVIIKLARERFVPVVGDDWYERRRHDAEGKFFRHVADQAGRGHDAPDGGPTCQGIYCLTAGGKLLYFKNAGQDPGEMRKALQWGLEAWDRLPESERKPGAVRVGDLKPDPHFTRTPPSGGLILNVYTRALERDARGELRLAALKVNGVNRSPQHDHLWLTEAECRSLIPAQPKQGMTVPVPDAVTKRIFRYHLVDSTLGEPVSWRANEVLAGELKLTVNKVTPAAVELRLSGFARLGTPTDITDLTPKGRGYEPRLAGTLRYDRKRKVLDRFDVVAVGDVWGDNPIYQAGRAGRQPLGVAFELVHGRSPADRVPPQGMRDWYDYLSGGR